MTSLITPADLAVAIRAERPPVLLDAQFTLTGTPGPELYAAAHLPGALFIDVDRDLADPPGAAGRHPLPDPHRLQKTLRELGIDDDDEVVAYDQGDGLGSARAWWVLSYAGLRAVRVLDGGLRLWRATGGPVTHDIPPPAEQPGSVTVHPGALPVLTADGAAALARDELLLDVRAPARFEGREEPMDPVAGRIPGARNAPVSDVTDASGRLLEREALHAYFADRGVFDHSQVGVYCGSGITAARMALALRQIGITPQLYAGSWSEWITDPSRPVATGP